MNVSRMSERTIDEFRAFEERMHQLAKVCCQTSAANGFVPTRWENLPAYLMFVVTEIAEALEAETLDSFAEEVADVAIRLMVHLHSLWGPAWSLRVMVKSTTNFSFTPLMSALRRVSQAARVWRNGKAEDNDTEADVRICLELALADCFATAELFGFSLLEAAAEKASWNATRPRLHGRVETIG